MVLGGIPNEKDTIGLGGFLGAVFPPNCGSTFRNDRAVSHFDRTGR